MEQKKFEKGRLIVLLALFVIVVGGVLLVILLKNISNNPNEEPRRETVECIGQNSVLYTQLGCYYCEIQEDMFGENKKYLNIVDCFYEPEKCQNITETPLWIIKGKEYLGVQNIETLRNLTGC